MLHARRSQIVDKITKERMVKITDLVSEYQVSIETIRRDLEYLEKHGYLKRVYGGAVRDGLFGQEPEYENRAIINYENKRAIGAKAAELIEDGDILFIDLGTTALEVAKCLARKKGLSVITNATQIARTMVAGGDCRVILLGGEMRRGELSVSGFLTDENLQYFHANKAIIGVGGITVGGGITDYHVDEANTRRQMIKRVDEVIAVADFSKFGVTAMNSCCPTSCIDILVTDWTTPAKAVAEYGQAGVKVVVAPALA